MTKGRWLVVGVLLGLSACVHRPASRDSRTARHDLPPLSYYDAGGAVPEPLERCRKTRRDSWALERIVLPARVPPELRDIPHAQDPIEVLHYRPRLRADRPHPLILVSPILANSPFLADQFAIDLAKHGMHAAIVPRKDMQPGEGDTFGQAEGEARLVVMRSRQALDWLLMRKDVDPRRLGTFGISAGAITSAMVAGGDARLRAHVWMLGGGPLADVMADTSESSFQDYRRQTMAATSLSAAALRTRMREALRTDPVRLAARVRTQDVLLVLAREDTSVPYRWGLCLWEALGRPERITTPLGHYTTFLLLPWLQVQTRTFFRRRFGTER